MNKSEAAGLWVLFGVVVVIWANTTETLNIWNGIYLVLLIAVFLLLAANFLSKGGSWFD